MNDKFPVPAFVNEILDAAVAFMPRLATAAAILLLGLMFAYALRRLSLGLVDVLDRFGHRFFGLRAGDRALWHSRSVAIVPRLLYWLTLLVFIGVAASVLGIGAINHAVESILGFVPVLLTASLILGGGYVLGGIVRDALIRSSARAGFAQAEVLGRWAQVMVVGAALLVSAAQIGIDISLIVNLVTVVIGALLGSFALGIGLGTPNHVNNYLSARYLRQQFEEGEELRIGSVQGRLLRIDKRAIVLQTCEGEMHIPARLLLEQPALRLGKSPDEADAGR